LPLMATEVRVTSTSTFLLTCDAADSSLLLRGMAWRRPLSGSVEAQTTKKITRLNARSVSMTAGGSYVVLPRRRVSFMSLRPLGHGRLFRNRRVDAVARHGDAAL